MIKPGQKVNSFFEKDGERYATVAGEVVSVLRIDSYTIINIKDVAGVLHRRAASSCHPIDPLPTPLSIVVWQPIAEIVPYRRPAPPLPNVIYLPPPSRPRPPALVPDLVLWPGELTETEHNIIDDPVSMSEMLTDEAIERVIRWAMA